MTSADYKEIVDDLNLLRRILLDYINNAYDIGMINDAIERIRSKLVDNLDIVEVQNEEEIKKQ